VKRYTLREPDGTLLGHLEMPDDATADEVNEAAERRVAELRVEAARKAVKEVVERPPPPPPIAYVRGSKDPLDDSIRCPVCRVPSPPVKRRDLMEHLRKHDEAAGE
jgi:hypothetical protein